MRLELVCYSTKALIVAFLFVVCTELALRMYTHEWAARSYSKKRCTSSTSRNDEIRWTEEKVGPMRTKIYADVKGTQTARVQHGKGRLPHS
ncbi:hypothetical protein EV361DRAFT_555143 [Lentinula raphanica]|nr:hypothetical protein EV361DRAFT_555143 [Lentinula raphanica]